MMVSSIAVWVRLNELPIEYYDSEALLIIGQAIGNVLRIDTHTVIRTRGRYAKLCIQVDIEKPLANVVLVNNLEQPITYEGLHRFCFSCEHIGHWREECNFTIKKPSPEKGSMLKGREILTMKDNNAKELRPHATHEVDPKDDTYGPWMVVSRKKSSNRKDKRHDSAPTNPMHTTWHEGPDKRVGLGEATKLTPGVILKINEGKRKANGELAVFGESLKELSSFKGKCISLDSPNKLGLLNQGTIKAHEGPSSIKGKKVLARLRATPANARGSGFREGNRSSKIPKTIWTPTNDSYQLDNDGKFQLLSKSRNDLGSIHEGKDSVNSNNSDRRDQRESHPQNRAVQPRSEKRH